MISPNPGVAKTERDVVLFSSQNPSKHLYIKHYFYVSYIAQTKNHSSNEKRNRKRTERPRTSSAIKARLGWVDVMTTRLHRPITRSLPHQPRVQLRREPDTSTGRCDPTARRNQNGRQPDTTGAHLERHSKWLSIEIHWLFCPRCVEILRCKRTLDEVRCGQRIRGPRCQCQEQASRHFIRLWPVQIVSEKLR